MSTADETPADELGLLAWGRRFLPDHFSRPPSKMHDWFDERLAEFRTERGRRLNVIGPRGSAKSTVASLAYILRAAVERTEPYIWLVSDTVPQAQMHLDNIKAELTDNDLLAAAYENACGKGRVWRSAVIILKNEVVIEALSTGQRIRGRRRRHTRPTLIVADDLQNDAHILSARQREKSTAWFHGALLPVGTKTTNIIHLATALHREALALQLHKTPGWTSRIFRAIERWPDNMKLWEEWEAIYCGLGNSFTAGASDHLPLPLGEGRGEGSSGEFDNPQPNKQHEIPHPHPLPTGEGTATTPTDAAHAFYLAHRAEMDAGAELLWPDEEDLYTLMCLRTASGRTAFEREKQSSPISPEGCEFPEAYFSEPLWFEDWPAGLETCVIALDPSKGADARRGDYSAFVVLGVMKDGRIYVEADLARRPTPQMVAEGTALCLRFRPTIFGVESNQYQELLAGEFAAEFARQGLFGLNPYPLDNRVNKLVRIRRLGPYLSGRRMRFKERSAGTRLLIEQLKDFPLGEHDDGPDALEMALRLAVDYLTPLPDDGLGSSLIRMS